MNGGSSAEEEVICHSHKRKRNTKSSSPATFPGDKSEQPNGQQEDPEAVSNDPRPVLGEHQSVLDEHQPVLNDGKPVLDDPPTVMEDDEPVLDSPPVNTAAPWKGWAELENSPDVFSIVLNEWGLNNVRVDDICEIEQLFEYSHADLLGLVFLSRWGAPDTTTTTAAANSDESTPRPKPWFANQISKFSCGSVAMMNIIMNAPDLSLSSELARFYKATQDLSAKDRGLQLDEHQHFRAVHNSFSTKLDRLMVDQSMKEDMQAARSTQRKRKGRKRRRKFTAVDDEDENGFHFVAYLPSGGSVWKLDGLQDDPQILSAIGQDEVWTQTASADIFQQMSAAAAGGFDFSLMAIVKSAPPSESSQKKEAAESNHGQRMREDWAPFIEHMIRLHAEKGDLAQLLGL